MIGKKDKDMIIGLAKKYKARSVYLFGSSLGDPKLANDIDLGVKGVDPKFFFHFYAEMMRGLSKPVDIVDLSDKTKFTELVKKRGIKIYG